MPEAFACWVRCRQSFPTQLSSPTAPTLGALFACDVVLIVVKACAVDCSVIDVPGARGAVTNVTARRAVPHG